MSDEHACTRTPIAEARGIGKFASSETAFARLDLSIEKSGKMPIKTASYQSIHDDWSMRALVDLWMRITSFENVKDQIGFCGIWCGSCPAGSGTIMELTRIYEGIIKNNKLEKWAPKDFDFREFMKGLNSSKDDRMPWMPQRWR